MLRWINLGLALALATLLLVELTRSTQSEPPEPQILQKPPVVVQETPGRRSRRVEARQALEERRREERERRVREPGPVILDSSGMPVKD